METGVLTPVCPARMKPLTVQKTAILKRLIPLIVQEVAERESEDKWFSKTTFSNVYAKLWKNAGDMDASKATLSAAIDLALVDGNLKTELRENESGRDTAVERRVKMTHLWM
jgi:hypothetical protein